tara:strand:+ start:911 stop:1648 length:738 start_codon:yes stop_codon:yes gene_type:complete
MRKLLTTGNPKTEKSNGLGYLTAIMHLAPAKLAGVGNLCPWASPGCLHSCLHTAGRGGIIKAGETTNAIQRARIARSKLFANDRAAFLAQLRRESVSHVRRAQRNALRPAIRLNGTSDLPWERLALDLFAEFSGVRFYDYTKSSKRMRQQRETSWPHNYSLTFSRSETNTDEALALLSAGHNVAVVFRGALPEYWNGFPVINGDEHDLRFLDPIGGFVVGLKAKGKARRDHSGFVVDSNELALAA